MNLSWRSTFRLLLGISLIVLVLPFALMAVEQTVGVLGDSAGAWSGSWERFTLFLPSAVLLPAIIVMAVLLAALEKRLRPLVGGLGLLGLHVAGVLIQYEALGWLVETVR